MISISFVWCCGQNGSKFIGDWSINSNVVTISKSGDNYLLKIRGDSSQLGQKGYEALNGIYTLAPENNLRDTRNLGIVIIYDQSRYCLKAFGIPKNETLTLLKKK